MKLRVRISILCAAVFTAAICVCDVVIWSLCKRALTDSALTAAYADSYAVCGKFVQYSVAFDDLPDKTAVAYFFKSIRDDYTVCIDTQTGAELHNNTVFTAETLLAKDKSVYASEIRFSYSLFRWEGKPVICFYNSSLAPGFTLMHLTDISGTYRQLSTLGLEMLAVSLLICAVVIVSLFFVIKRSLQPLGVLSDKARRISAGRYDERISPKRTDEVGQLALDFNKMADAVEKRESALVQSEERKTLFMGSLTHELRTPLTAISGYAEAMQRARLSAEDTAEALYYIKSECGRLTRLSGKIMRLLELEHGTALNPETVPVRALFDAVRRSCTKKAEDGGIALVFSDTAEVLECDVDLMTDVLINLTDNAVKASERGARVLLYTERDRDGFFIVVQDAGRGIPQEELSQIFEPFYMVDKSRSRKTGGAGLGLSLTALVLERHGFPLSVESRVGVGTVMRIYISMKS